MRKYREQLTVEHHWVQKKNLKVGQLTYKYVYSSISILRVALLGQSDCLHRSAAICNRRDYCEEIFGGRTLKFILVLEMDAVLLNNIVLLPDLEVQPFLYYTSKYTCHSPRVIPDAQF